MENQPLPERKKKVKLPRVIIDPNKKLVTNMTVDEIITSVLYPDGEIQEKQGKLMEGKSKFNLDDQKTR